MTPTREQLQKMKRHACAGCGMTDDEWAEVRGWNDAIDAVLAALAPQEAAPGVSNVRIPEHHQRAAATFRALATPVPMSDAERAAHDPDYGLTSESVPMPPIEPGDMIVFALSNGEKRERVVSAVGAPRWNKELRHMVLAHYKPVWRWEPR